MNIGRQGEKIAAKYLLEKGFKIIIKNYHSRYGEVDIICENENYLVFVEVKSKIYSSLSNLSERVDFFKQKKFLKTVQIYLSENTSEKQPRIDVLQVIIFRNSHKIIHIENAF